MRYLPGTVCALHDVADGISWVALLVKLYDSVTWAGWLLLKDLSSDSNL